MGWCTVVSGGSAIRDTSRSSKPITATSEGTRRPALRSVRSAPAPMLSLAANTPSRSGWFARSAAMAAAPLGSVKSPPSEGYGSSPAASMASW